MSSARLDPEDIEDKEANKGESDEDDGTGHMCGDVNGDVSGELVEELAVASAL